MKNIVTILLLFTFSGLLSQNSNLIVNSCVENGINVTSKAEKVNSEELLNKYLSLPIYKIYLKNDNKEAVEFGPAKTDLMKIFGGTNGDKGYYCLKDLSGLNFASVQALNIALIDLRDKIEVLEESQELLNKQTADLSELQNQVLDLTSTIEELKQKNDDLENTINDLKVEINNK